MSGEIDLAKVIDPEARKEARWVIVQREHVLALVAAVRAAKTLNNTPASVNNWKALDAALSPFTDSAEVRSDGE